MTIDVLNLDRLLPEEKIALRNLFFAWESLKNAKNWIEADRLRWQLMMWDSQIVNDKIWQPMLENNLNRQRRAAFRMKRYGIPVYPWNLSDAA